MPTFSLSINGVVIHHAGQPNDKLLGALHEHGLTSPKLGCGAAQCGACVVWLDGKAQPACDSPLWVFENQASAPKVLTLEGLSTAEPLISQALQRAFEVHQAAQCGYCSAGILMKAAELIKLRTVEVSTIYGALDEHLCRCGSHHRIVRAILDAAASVRLAETI
jgi:nicotinate dehydrogenase subunit A